MCVPVSSNPDFTTLAATSGCDVALAQRVGPDAVAARNRLIFIYEPWIKDVVRSLKIPTRDRQDALQAGRVGFMESLQRFDPSRGGTLEAFAYRYVRFSALKAVYGDLRSTSPQIDSQSVMSVRDIYLDELPADHSALACYDTDIDKLSDGEFDALPTALRLRKVHDWVASLPLGQRDLVHRLYWRDEHQAAIAQARGVSRAAIHRQLERVLEKGRRSLSPA
jgi:RNA polymerase sigma factor (sigma-70 family)